MTVPTAQSLKYKFSPTFNAVDDGTIELAIEEAVVNCGNGDWVDDANLTLALYYYAAHLLQVAMTRAASGSAGQIISSERTPDLSVTYAVPNPNAPLDYTSTIYGERYLGLIKKNFPAVLVVNSGVAA